MGSVDKASPMKAMFCRWLAKETRGFVGGAVGGLIGGLLAFLSINYFSRLGTVSGTDAVSIANTYIVYTTFVIAAVALLLTVAGLIFTQHFAIEKEAHMEHAFSAVLTLVQSDDGKAQKMIQHIMDNPAVIDYLSEALSQKIDQELASRRANADATSRDAAQQVKDIDLLSSDLSTNKHGPKDAPK
ncbi:hypothetical protein IV454_03890 [Massilia antarctica]|uniref:MotA/TolQ/ExbB proton channel domain-containing protein n=2 Tax=Massilia antarctica TaxID=2765360 RepID=A0AA48WDN1_9BURK|nr:hypothetical protein IV454_03890 [Massilia antarctica]